MDLTTLGVGPSLVQEYLFWWPRQRLEVATVPTGIVPYDQLNVSEPLALAFSCLEID